MTDIKARPRMSGQGPNNNQPISTDPWVVGVNCHLIIDGVGYIVADSVDYGQESMKGMGTEQTAPFFGDPVNYVDPTSSDMTMLLPIGQNNFTSGIGSWKLETDPNGYEVVNNLQLTPQNTLFNGPQIVGTVIGGATIPTDTFTTWQQGYFAGTVHNGLPREWFAIGDLLYVMDPAVGVWSPIGLGVTPPFTGLFGFGGLMLVCWGTGGSLVAQADNSVYPVQYQPYGGMKVNGDPYIYYKDGRIYPAHLYAPAEPPAITSETGPDVSYMSWAYAVCYVVTLPDGTKLLSGVGPSSLVDKQANTEMVITLPGVPWRGGPVGRRLYRSMNNGNPDGLWQLADETVLGNIRTTWVDTMTDAQIAGNPQWDFSQQNNTAMMILRGGTPAHNMWRSYTNPIWLPEWNGVPNTQERVWNAVTYHDSSGNEALVIGTTSGLFSWDGTDLITQTLRPENYDAFNCFSLAVNHGVVYYTSGERTLVHVWSSSQEAFLNGPWLIQFNQPIDVRLVSAGEYLFVSASGISKYTGQYRTTIYRYNGTIFDWQTNMDTGATQRFPIMGDMISEHSFQWYPNDTVTPTIDKITLNPRYPNPQTNAVMFRSAMSDCGLPRLRKQVFAVMIRYLQLSQPVTLTSVISQEANPGDTRLYLSNTVGMQVGSWFAIDDPYPNNQEYRQITNVAPTYVDMSHPLGSGLTQTHAVGTRVYLCAATVTLRNIFTADNPTARDVQVGGPFRSDYLFSYIHLPNPVYTFLDGIQIDWSYGTIMELVGWSMLTALNPPYYGLLDVNIRVQDQVKLPNNLFHPYSAQDQVQALETAYNKGAVDVIDQLNTFRKMRVQRLSVDYEEPKQRHTGPYQNQATAHVRLLDQDSELMKQESLVLGMVGSTGTTTGQIT